MAQDDLTAALPERNTTGRRAVTAFFDTDEAAEMARADLIQAGVPTADIRVAGGESGASTDSQPHGFWASLREFFLPDEDQNLYAEGLRRGGYAVSVQTDAGAYDRVLEVLDRDGAVDMEERAAGWRDEGWSGTPASAIGEFGVRDERALTPAGSGTAGFGASMADQPLFDDPIDTSVIEPGLVTPVDPSRDRRIDATVSEPIATPAAADPTSPVLPPRDVPAVPGTLSPAPRSAPPSKAMPDSMLPGRDLSHGRSRVRSYISDPSSEI